MKKTGYVCYPCWKENGREKPYSRSYDLIAHMVNVHEKYPDGAVNKAAYSTHGNNVRDATEEEKVRYRDANKHRRKKVDEKSSSGEPSRSRTEMPAEAPLNDSSTSKNKERGEAHASSGNRTGANGSKHKERESSKKAEGLEEAGKSDDRDDT